MTWITYRDWVMNVVALARGLALPACTNLYWLAYQYISPLSSLSLSRQGLVQLWRPHSGEGSTYVCGWYRAITSRRRGLKTTSI
jgi:hypothetical protein